MMDDTQTAEAAIAVQEPDETADQAVDTIEDAETTEPYIPDAEAAALRVSERVEGVQHERDFERLCLEPLTADQMADYARKMADDLREIEDIEAEAKEEAKAYKERIQTIEFRVRGMGRSVRLGTENLLVLCSEFFDRTYGRAYVVRQDTGEVVMNRPLNEDERQLYMQFPEGQDADDTDEADQEGDEAADSDAPPALELSEHEEEPVKPLTPMQARRAARALQEAAEAA
jgi:hypothetical protein